MYDDDDNDEKNLALALALSKPVADTEVPKVEAAKEEAKPTEKQVDIDADFMKDVIGDIGIDLDAD